MQVQCCQDVLDLFVHQKCVSCTNDMSWPIWYTKQCSSCTNYTFGTQKVFLYFFCYNGRMHRCKNRKLWVYKTDVCGIIAANLAKVQAFECRWSETREEVG